MHASFARLVRCVALVALANVHAAPVEAGAGAQAAPQPHPASVHLRAYIAAFNTGDPAVMRTFFEEHFAASELRENPVDARVKRFEQARTRFRTMTLEKIAAEQTHRSFALVTDANRGTFLLGATVEPDPPHKLLAITLESVDDPADLVVPDPKRDDAELAGAVRRELETKAKADQFSGVVLVARRTQVLFHEAYGFADREKKTPNRLDTRFNLGSINKVFTQVAIHQLARAGKLSLDDTIGRHLPDYPNKEAVAQVTIRHLLEMTSGIGDFFGARYDATPKDRIRSINDYLPLFADQPLAFAPGTGNRYSNGGYIVLGAIIERVTGTDYYSWVRENIFVPCGMTATDSFPRGAGTPNLAVGYTRRGREAGPWVPNLDSLPGRGSSAGGGYSTTEDLLRFVQAASSGRVVLPDRRGGLGIAGGAPGISAALEWDSRSGYVVIVLTNLDPPTATDVARRVTSWLPE